MLAIETKLTIATLLRAEGVARVHFNDDDSVTLEDRRPLPKLLVKYFHGIHILRMTTSKLWNESSKAPRIYSVTFRFAALRGKRD